MVLGTKAQYQKALDKAHKLGMVAKVRPAGRDRYTVPSNTDPERRYVVNVLRDGEYLCDCHAAGRGLPCCHAAATYLRVITERAMRAAVAPKPVVSAREELWGKAS